MEQQRKKVFIEESKEATDNTVFDDVFRTMLERIPEIMIPLINEVFGTHYAENEIITQLKNEHYTKGGVIITDCILDICGKQYHLECQSNPDSTIALRMIEYDMAIALQDAKEVSISSGTEHDYELTFPHSCILYLRQNSQTKDKASVKIRFQDGTSHLYAIPIVKVQEYAKEEIFEKKLLAFLPYYLMRYESRISEICKDEEKAEKLQDEYRELREKLEKSAGEENGLWYVELISHMRRVASRILQQEPTMREKMEAITMGGQVYETLTDQFLARGREEGRVEGHADGLYFSVGRLVDRKQYTEKEACELLDVRYEDYLRFKEMSSRESRQEEEEIKKQELLSKNQEPLQRQLNRVYSNRRKL